MSKKMTRDEALATLEAAITAYQGDIGPGHWEAQDYREGESVALVYDTAGEGDGPGPHTLIQDGSEPWQLWGGNAILAAAGLESNDGYCEAYSSRGTADLDRYYDAAIIPIRSEDDE